MITRMLNYLRKTYKKLGDDVLAKAIYDVGKYAIVVLFTFVVLKLFPEDTSIGEFLQKKVIISVLQFCLIIFSAVILTVIIYFLVNRRRFAIIRHDLFTDELTGIPNHRALSQDLKTIIDWAKTENKPLSIILMDIDNFKEFNSKYGLKHADEILIKFGTLLKLDNRNTDSVYRQHVKGDEFVIITKETILENAVKAADRKRENIASTGIQISGYSEPFKLTVCCGVVEFNPKTDNEDTILERGFNAMKEAKNKPGKNLTVSLI